MRHRGFSTDYGALPRMEQLDGLRAIAVLLVFYHHWMPWSYQFNLPLGEFGVDLFFILSGFLITGILLKCRRYTENDGQSVMVAVRQFYARRFLRIFPLYYVVLLACTFMAPVLTNGLTPWLWSYTLNLYRSLVNNTWGSPISHLWSLSIEEQFYLLWPWVILLVPRRLLLRVIVLAILIGPATKAIIALAGGSGATIRYFTLSCFDTLAMGALLAYFVDQKGLSAVSRSSGVKWLLGISLPIVLAGFWLKLTGDTPSKLTLLAITARTLLFGWVVIKAAQGFKGPAGYVLASPLVVYLGRISYGLYLLHKPIPFILRKLRVPLEVLPPVVTFFIYTSLSIIVAALSWRLFESPINSLKRRFPYRQKNASDETLPMTAGA